MRRLRSTGRLDYHAFDRAISAERPLHFYRFLENAGDTIYDYGSAAKDASRTTGTTAFVSGPLGLGRSFDGSTYYTCTGANFPNNDLTVLALFEVSSSSSYRTIVGAKNELTLRVNNADKLEFLVGDVASEATSPDTVHGRTVLGGVTKPSGANPTMYIDGVPVAATGLNSTNPSGSGGAGEVPLIGAQNSSPPSSSVYFAGSIFRVAVWDRVLTMGRMVAIAQSLYGGAFK